MSILRITFRRSKNEVKQEWSLTKIINHIMGINFMTIAALYSLMSNLNGTNVATF
jgi:hypothetical protein